MLWRLLGIPGVRPSCWRWLWAVRAVAFKRQEGRQSWVRAPSVITRPVSVGNYVTNFFFFLMGLNGRAFIERLSVKFGCGFFFSFLFKTDS